MKAKKFTINKNFLLIISSIIIFTILIVIILFVFILPGTKTRDDKTSFNNFDKAAIFTVEALSHSESIEVSGYIEPIKSQDLGFNTSGELIILNVDKGSSVKKGDLLAQLNDSEEVYNLASLDLNIEEEQLKGSKRQLDLLQLQRKLRLSDLDNKKLLSPINGIISNIEVDLGDFIKANSNIMRVIDKNSMRAKVEVDELDVPHIKIGQKVIFRFGALSEKEFIGYVCDLPLEGRVTNQGISVLDAEIQIDNPDTVIIPYYSFTAEIIISDQEEVLIVDSRGIRQRNGNALAFKLAETEGNPQRIRLEIEPFSEGKIRILSGLKEGDRIYDLSSMNRPAKEKNNFNIRIPGMGGNRRGPGSGGPGGSRGRR